jgi:hypothetical protein
MGRAPSANRAYGKVENVPADVSPERPLCKLLIFHRFGKVGNMGNVFRSHPFQARARARACAKGRKSASREHHYSIVTTKRN